MRVPLTPSNGLGDPGRAHPEGASQRGFVIPAFLLDPRVWAAMAVVGAALGAWWYVHSLHNQIETLQAWKDEAIRQSEANKAETIRLTAANDAHSKEVANGYASAIRSITTDYDSRIKRLLSTPSGGSAARVSEAASGTDDPSPDTRFGTGAEAPALADICTQLEKDAAVTTVQLLFLQHWIKGVQ